MIKIYRLYRKLAYGVKPHVTVTKLSHKIEGHLCVVCPGLITQDTLLMYGHLAGFDTDVQRELDRC